MPRLGCLARDGPGTAVGERLEPHAWPHAAQDLKDRNGPAGALI